MNSQQPAGASARATSLQRSLSAWQSFERYYNRHAGEFWDIRIPLMTMVGLTLIGLYDCKAVTLCAPAGDLGQAQAQEWAELEPKATGAQTGASVAVEQVPAAADRAKQFELYLGTPAVRAASIHFHTPVTEEIGTRQLQMLCASIHANAPPSTL